METDINPGNGFWEMIFMEQTVYTVAARSQQASCQGGVFVPVQENADMWTPQEALCMGTAFPCLYSPWEKGKGDKYDG